jgi:predicted permease
MIMEAIKGEQGPLAVLKDIATNRLIVVIALGFAWNFSGLALHDGFSFFLDMATASATPVALFSLGVILSGQSLQSIGGPVWAVVGFKNFLMPLLAVIMLGTFLAPSPAWEAPSLLMYGAPSGVLAFVLGLKYGVKVESIAKAVIISTALSILTAATLA